MTDRDLTRTEGEGETLDMPEGMGAFTKGQVLGERYQILEMLGRGGMGEVWQAFDLKLRVEVALKALRPEFFKSERRLELLRQEVRAAREVMSPNVCRIFDLIEIEGRELVSMEYVDGATLLGVLQERGPLDLKEAQDIASQFLAGLEAIHKVGLIHRDIKPENIMLTRAGRVVVMDFGLARQEVEGGGSVSGTPAYMAPEQAAGQQLDARADVYAAGVVLAEMVSPDGIKSYDSRQSVWEGVRSEPAKLPDSPWAPVLNKAVAKDREGRFNTARTLTRALEDVTLRVEGAEDLHPYPGLSSFTEDNAEYFFGREAEVEQMWRKLEGPPRMLAIMGPSGAGKSSFIAAGLTPNAPFSWSIICCTPGSAAIPSLRGALTSVLAHGSENLEHLLTDPDNPDVIVEAVASSREGRSGALLIIDQFEELFTLNSRDEQKRFASLLARLPLEADIHVVLSMRDDFAAACSSYDVFQPVFHDLTMLNPPTGGNLRRALAQPATKCGYRFEDDDLVEEILGEVEGERGALPLMAFALAQLWEKRDRDSGLLTRQAYLDIGGAGGALARHAEATIDRVGVERIPIVRELFRNLVTAEGTRAVREWNELLSVFDTTGVSREGINPSPTKDGATTRGINPSPTKEMRASKKQNVGAGFIPAREAAEEVLRELIDARLLTSYEVREDEHEPTRRVEIIHESLLANWPRLVRWQTQDQEGAQLRDELRQAARSWDEHGRHDDRLWVGTANREFQLWRERYPGGLSETEEAFASAMTNLATRRKRLRRIAATTVVVVFAAVALVFAGLWRRSVEEARRAEAANLLSLGQLKLDSYPTATVAHAIASLELADTPNARRLALDALWRGPTTLVATEGSAPVCRFSPDGRSLLQSRNHLGEEHEGHLSLIRVDGSRVQLANAHPGASEVYVSGLTASGHFASLSRADPGFTIAVWSHAEKRPLSEVQLQSAQGILGFAVDSGRQRVVIASRENEYVNVDVLGFGGDHHSLGTLDFEFRRDEAGRWTTSACLDARAGEWIGVVSQDEVYGVEIGTQELSPAKLLGQHADRVTRVACDPLGRFLATADAQGNISLWGLANQSRFAAFQGPPGIFDLSIEADGIRMRAMIQEEGHEVAWVWDLSTDPPRWLGQIRPGSTGEGSRWWWNWDAAGRQFAVSNLGPNLFLRFLDAPAEAEPLVLFRGDNAQIQDFQFNPRGEWLATADIAGLALWPLSRDYPIVLRGHEQPLRDLVFAPDGSWLASSSLDGKARLWPLVGDPPEPRRDLGYGESLAVSPDGEQIIAGTGGRGPIVYSTRDAPPKRLEGFSGQVVGLAFSPDGRLIAATGGMFDPAERVIRVWDAASGDEVTVLEIGETPKTFSLQFTEDGHMLSMSESGLLRWDVDTGARELLYEATIFVFSADASGQRVVVVESEDPSKFWGRATLLDLDSGTATPLEKFGNDVLWVSLDPSGSTLVTSDRDGEVRVGSLTGEEPHLLAGHDGSVLAVAIDPLGRWIASGGHDKTIRLWPMPDLSKPPIHTLPREELLAKLKTLTNLRVVRDEESATGWKLTHDPFPGWETVPTW